MQELVKNGKIEEYWKEATVELPANEEYTYVVQNKNTNCIFIRNHSNANITAGAKPCSHEVFIAPNNTGVLSRPFPLKYAYLTADKPASISVVETISQDPVANVVQQEVIHKVEIQNKLLEVSQEAAFKPLFIQQSSTAAPLSVTLDTGFFGRPIVNVWMHTNAPAIFRVLLSNDNVIFFPRANHQFTAPTGGNAFIVFSDNAFRFVKAATDAANNNTIVIGAAR